MTMKHLHRLFVALAFIGFIGGLLLTGSFLEVHQLLPFGIAAIILMCVGVAGDLIVSDKQVYKGDEYDDF